MKKSIITSTRCPFFRASITLTTLKDSRRDMYVQWWLRAISFIGATATGIGVSQALHYFWR